MGGDMKKEDVIRIAKEVWGDDSGKPWHESALAHLEAFAMRVETMIVEKACWERGCACYDHRVDEGVEVTLAREWQGLSKDEVLEILFSCEPSERGYVAAMVEAKLKEKNT
jgi:hypothetical protein